jgi:hypothetical protein
VQDLAVAHGLHRQAALGIEQATGGPAQRPTAVLRAVVGHSLAGVTQQMGKQFTQRDGFRQRDVDAPLRGGDGDAGEADAGRGRHGAPPPPPDERGPR